MLPVVTAISLPGLNLKFEQQKKKKKSTDHISGHKKSSVCYQVATNKRVLERKPAASNVLKSLWY